jgi:hypothetical protein
MRTTPLQLALPSPTHASPDVPLLPAALLLYLIRVGGSTDSQLSLHLQAGGTDR